MTRSEKITQYLQAIDNLDTGGRTALKRAAGSRLQDAPKALAAFYAALPYGVPDWQTQRWFAAGCLHCLADDGDGPAVPLPDILRKLRNEESWSSHLQSRVIQLLDTAWDDRDGYLLIKLTRLVKIMRHKGYRVDCGSLIQDLIDWNRESQTVQRRWASTIYRTKRKENTTDAL